MGISVLSGLLFLLLGFLVLGIGHADLHVWGLWKDYTVRINTPWEFCFLLFLQSAYSELLETPRKVAASCTSCAIL